MSELQQVTKHDGMPDPRAWLPESAAEVLSERFFDEQTCIDWFLSRAHPNGPRCPLCGGAITGDRLLATWRALKRLDCPQCRHKVSATTGTILHGLRFSPRTLFMAMALLGAGASLSYVARALNVNRDTVRALRDKVLALVEVNR